MQILGQRSYTPGWAVSLEEVLAAKHVLLLEPESLNRKCIHVHIYIYICIHTDQSIEISYIYVCVSTHIHVNKYKYICLHRNSQAGGGRARRSAVRGVARGARGRAASAC